MSELFRKLELAEYDHEKVNQLKTLETAFNNVKKMYTAEYTESMSSVLKEIKEKLQSNPKMCEAVSSYVREFVAEEKRDLAADELFSLLSAELAQTFIALTHTLL